jgi:hypothetical protein
MANEWAEVIRFISVDSQDWRTNALTENGDNMGHSCFRGWYALNCSLSGSHSASVGGGDFNDTLGSSPIDILDTAAVTITNLFYNLPDRQRWSYIFSGESQVLDHVYLTTNLLSPASGWEHHLSPVHVNADFPSSKSASDHPVRVRFGRQPLCVIGNYDVNDDTAVRSVTLNGAD